MRFGSGSGAGQAPFIARLLSGYTMPRWLDPILALGCVGAIVMGLAYAVWGSCTTIPEVPTITRANDICQAIKRGKPNPGCQWRVKKRFNIEIVPVGSQPEAAYFDLYIRSEHIGTFSIPDAIPVDLSTLDAGIIDRLLKYHIGPPEVQDAITAKFGRRGVFYIEEIIEWIEPPIEGQPAYLSGVGALAR